MLLTKMRRLSNPVFILSIMSPSYLSVISLYFSQYSPFSPNTLVSERLSSSGAALVPPLQ